MGNTLIRRDGTKKKMVQGMGIVILILMLHCSARDVLPETEEEY